MFSSERMIQIEKQERGRKSPMFSRKCQKEIFQSFNQKKLSSGQVFWLSDDNRPLVIYESKYIVISK